MSLLKSDDPAAFSEFRAENNTGLLFTSDHNGDAIHKQLELLAVPKYE